MYICDVQKIHFDMETSDPDDVMTLAILATHPDVDLIGVTLMPGTRHQVGLVKSVLRRLGKACPVGAESLKAKGVSEFHYKWLGPMDPEDADSDAHSLLEHSANEGATLLTGAPLKNLEKIPDFHRWVAQGGFAGDSVVPFEHRLPQFKGKETCPTFNFNGAPDIARDMLSFMEGDIQLVSKNVCHGVVWDQAFHDRVGALDNRTAGLDLVYEGMGLYLKKKSEGKKLHDPLAMAVAIDPSVCTFRKVEPYRNDRGEWGSRLTMKGRIEISISYDPEKFFKVLTKGEARGVWSLLG